MTVQESTAKSRAESREALFGARTATGDPGTKQPKHDATHVSAAKTVEKLGEIVKEFEGDTQLSSAERSKQPGNPHPVAPADRMPTRGPQVLAAAEAAAGAIGAAKTHLQEQLDADARLVSDPRYERDQKVFELGATGKLGLVPPSDAELDRGTVKPMTVEEQLDDDERRLGEAENKIKQTHIKAGEQESAKQNNGKTAQEAGKTGREAEAQAKAADNAPPSGPAPVNKSIK